MKITAKKIAQLRKMAYRLTDQAAEKNRDRPTHTAKMLKLARSAEREAAQMQRAAQFIHAYCDAAQAGRLPEILDKFTPTKAAFLEIAARKSKHVANGYHGYVVDTDQWSATGPGAVAIRQLSESLKTDDERQAEADQAKQLEIKRMVDELRNCDIEGFFPTPPAVIDRMIEAADMVDGMTVLEPSAGIGDIVERIAAEYPHAEIDAVEIRPSLQKILKAKGHGTVGGDFLEFSGNGRQYDRVLMNPPFERGADIVHVRHAFNFVKPGGRLVAIMPPSYEHGQSTTCKSFRAWLGEFEHEIRELPADAFNSKNAFRRTSVSTRIVVIVKPEETASGPTLGGMASAKRAKRAANLRKMAAGLAASCDATKQMAGRCIAGFADALGKGQLPAVLAELPTAAGRVPPTKSDFLAYARRTANGRGWVDESRIATAVRNLAVSPTQQAVEPPSEAVETAKDSKHADDDREGSQPPAALVGSLVQRYAPASLSLILGQGSVTDALQAFVRSPYSCSFVFAGPSGVGKTAAAKALANELGCDPEWGGVLEIPSGKQDGKAVEEMWRKMHLRPLGGSGWKVVIINEADCMTPQAEAMWLDVLEKLPTKVVVVFTTNNLHEMSDRFRRRSEVHVFDASSVKFREAMERHVRRVWKEQTGQQLGELPDGLGQFELADDCYSIALALQQIAPYIRTGKPLPDSFVVPIVRDVESEAHRCHS